MRDPLFAAGICVLLASGLYAQTGKSSVADAKREYAAIFTHPDKPCTGPEYSTVDYETCMNKELNFLRPHLDAFVAAIRGVQADSDAAAVQLFDKTNASWKAYRDNLCRLAYSGFEGGTGAAPAQQQCLYEQDRAYVKSIAAWTDLQTLAD
jgi:uncharacterized protein YecT (DUF1311 family)